MTLRKTLQVNQYPLKRYGSNEQTENLLEDIKKKSGDVIRIAITKRTIIELPASMTQEEVDARVANYKRLHTSKI